MLGHAPCDSQGYHGTQRSRQRPRTRHGLRAQRIIDLGLPPGEQAAQQDDLARRSAGCAQRRGMKPKTACQLAGLVRTVKPLAIVHGACNASAWLPQSDGTTRPGGSPHRGRRGRACARPRGRPTRRGGPRRPAARRPPQQRSSGSSANGPRPSAIAARPDAPRTRIGSRSRMRTPSVSGRRGNMHRADGRIFQISMARSPARRVRSRSRPVERRNNDGLGEGRALDRGRGV